MSWKEKKIFSDNLNKIRWSDIFFVRIFLHEDIFNSSLRDVNTLDRVNKLCNKKKKTIAVRHRLFNFHSFFLLSSTVRTNFSIHLEYNFIFRVVFDGIIVWLECLSFFIFFFHQRIQRMTNWAFKMQNKRKETTQLITDQKKKSHRTLNAITHFYLLFLCRRRRCHPLFVDSHSTFIFTYYIYIDDVVVTWIELNLKWIFIYSIISTDTHKHALSLSETEIMSKGKKNEIPYGMICLSCSNKQMRQSDTRYTHTHTAHTQQ